MSYPEKGATYKHEPKWMDRAQRDEGGSVDDSADGAPAKTFDTSSQAVGPWLGGEPPPSMGVRGSATPSGNFKESPKLQTGTMTIGPSPAGKPKTIWDQ